MSVSRAEINPVHIERPAMPVMLPVNFEPLTNGFLLSVKDAKNLDINLERLHTHIKALNIILDAYTKDLKAYDGN